MADDAVALARQTFLNVFGAASVDDAQALILAHPLACSRQLVCRRQVHAVN